MQILARLRHLKSLGGAKILVTWIAATWTVVGILVFVRDEFVEPILPHHDGAWRVVRLIPQVSTQAWVIIALVIVVLWAFEASFRLSERRSQDTGRLNDGIGQLLARVNELSSHLQPRIIVRKSDRDWIPSTIGKDSNLLCCLVEVENISGADVDNCQIYVDGIADGSREADHDCSFPSSMPFSLRPGERKLLPVISIRVMSGDENAYPIQPPGSNVQVVFPPNNYTLRVRVYASGSAPADLDMRLAHDPGGWSLAAQA